ncbi:hypothetical protein AU468_09990 [Alkalispirochaeta sphaeroplastigenens]|uniref:PEGA domain-containing protein n=1 Tax=Alkalispirochaeta sphaeroplastigenens TaxID=1187066 RepID=A0A2S4JJT8_9SPIO|nr:hypothetical protein [Alkalispirochaeta sphaeroplastigenens]POQ99807.1 hypothetical protein AU468_09990 [Alkalispirochaeta sphaeroplastigenens]
MRKTLKAAVLCAALVLVLALSGCATVVSTAEYPVAITSRPTGAEFTIERRDGKIIHSGVTPSTVTLSSRAGFFRGERYTVKMQHPGHEPRVAEIDRRVSKWYIFGNLLWIWGGPVGWLVVDPASGAMWNLEDLHLDMDPAGK